MEVEVHVGRTQKSLLLARNAFMVNLRQQLGRIGSHKMSNVCVAVEERRFSAA